VVGSSNNDNVNWYVHDAATNIAVVRAPGTSGPDAGLDYPLDAIIGPDGNLYVSGWNSGNVVRYNPTTGAFIDEFATGGTEAAGMAFGPDGNLYVANDGAKNVVRFDGTTGAFMDEFVAAGSGGLKDALGLAFGPDGNLYVGSYGTDEVLRFNGTTGAMSPISVATTSSSSDKTLRRVADPQPVFSTTSSRSTSTPPVSSSPT